MSDGETKRKLAAMTDQGAFERLATAVLRQSDSRYRLLAHPGVNLDGKTVKSPVDGITFVTGSNPPHMIAVHHTTCKADDLESKWLHDPTTVKPRKGKKPTQPPGDLVKTIAIFEEQKALTPDLQATLILTTNKEPSEHLVRTVNAAGKKAGVDIEIWPGSAISDFLDFDANGQWIRREFLQIDQERLSGELLHELSQRSLENRFQPIEQKLWIDRELDHAVSNTAGRDVIFIVAESGLGKSVACHKRLSRHITSGGYGLVIPHEIIAISLSLDQAVEKTLQHLHPSLLSGAGSEARALASQHTPLLLVAEDINKSEQPTALLERVANWSRTQQEPDVVPNWQLLCPVWPRTFSTLGEEARKKIDKLAITASPFSTGEGTSAVLRRAEQNSLQFTQLEAEEMTSVLGHDPLLIALHDLTKKATPEHVIQGFIDRSLERLSGNRGDYTAGEYRNALRQLATAMLEQRTFEPTMPEIGIWLGQGAEAIKMLRHIIGAGEVMRAVGTPSDERLAFRHDRVRDWLLADAVSDLMCRNAISEEVLKEPYFAEIIGAALVSDDISVKTIQQVRGANPLAIFCAMRVFGEPRTDLHRSILDAAEAWLDDQATHETALDHLRWNAVRVLSEFEASYVARLVGRFHEEKDHWWGLRARFRNGDFKAGIQLCLEHGPGIGVTGHLELIDHVHRTKGKELIHELDQLLRGSQLTDAGRIGALRLAGHVGEASLGDAIKASWSGDADREDKLADYLWAGAQCCGDDPANLLIPVCDAWEALSDQSDKEGMPSPRDNLAAHEIRWAFQTKPPETAICYFIDRARTSELRGPITYMLHGIDHPDAVEFLARELAETDDRLEGSGSFSPFAMTAKDEWRRAQEDKGRPMSVPSRSRLHALWKDKSNGKHLRKRALQLWCSTLSEGDISLLQTIRESDDLADMALFERLRRGDQSAIAALTQNLTQDNSAYWWQAGRHIWSDELTNSLNATLIRRGQRVGQTWDENDSDEGDWIVSERLMELPTITAEKLLIEHWDHLRYSPRFVQAALYVATPHLLEEVSRVVEKCPNPENLFKYLTSHFGFKVKGRTGVTRFEQVAGLVPYVGHLADLDILHLWEVCNDHGWFDLRRKYFDSRVKLGKATTLLNDDAASHELDDMLAKNHTFWADHWVERYLESGVSVDHVMEVVGTWLKQQTDIRALIMAANIVSHAGRRDHLKILSSHNIGAIDQTEPIILDACFALKRRSLR